MATTWPEALVERTLFGVPRKRLVVEAVVEKRLPAVKAVEDAKVKVELPVTFKVEPMPSAPVTVKAPIWVEEA